MPDSCELSAFSMLAIFSGFVGPFVLSTNGIAWFVFLGLGEVGNGIFNSMSILAAPPEAQYVPIIGVQSVAVAFMVVAFFSGIMDLLTGYVYRYILPLHLGFAFLGLLLSGISTPDMCFAVAGSSVPLLQNPWMWLFALQNIILGALIYYFRLYRRPSVDEEVTTPLAQVEM